MDLPWQQRPATGGRISNFRKFRQKFRKNLRENLKKNLSSRAHVMMAPATSLVVTATAKKF